ncbi:MAG TPA: small ribosomal subunit Rsm22 family protein [Verrucomicrobiae bacterium]|nr:small ribosomal subunit Rsm22 family protein [Verrucomicrobiae bacterium]
MHLPPHIRAIVDERAEAIGFAALKRAATAMSDAYRDGDPSRTGRLLAAERAAAYLVTRLPATYAAAFRVLGEVSGRLAGRPVTSILDIGAGAGAASLAALHWFPTAALTLVERDGAFAEIARECLPDAAIRMDDVAHIDPLPPHDLVIAGYSLGEMPAPVAARAWRAARAAMVVIEPGTPAGFGRIRELRDRLLADGAHMIAPCPAESPCPLHEPDWCHFGARVERSSLHRRIKQGELSYEDEKFSYLALARDPAPLAAARILRRPEHRPGLVSLEICRGGATTTERVPHRDRDRFRAARAALWGDPWTGT